MAHADAEIRECEDRLIELRADRDAENAALAQAKPQSIPNHWIPITYKLGKADWVVVGWIDPAYRVSVYRSAQGLSGIAAEAVAGLSLPSQGQGQPHP